MKRCGRKTRKKENYGEGQGGSVMQGWTVSICLDLRVAAGNSGERKPLKFTLWGPAQNTVGATFVLLKALFCMRIVALTCRIQ